MRGKITILFVTITQTKDVTSTNAPNANDSNSQDANLRLILLLIVRQISIVLIPEPDLFICADTMYSVTIHQYLDHIHDTAQTQCLELDWEQSRADKVPSFGFLPQAAAHTPAVDREDLLQISR